MVRLRRIGNIKHFPQGREESGPWTICLPLEPGSRAGQYGMSESSHRATTYLRCHKVGCVARCHEEPVLSPQLLGKAKVTDTQALGVPRLIHIQDVTGFEIPVDDLGAEGWGRYMVW